MLENKRNSIAKDSFVLMFVKCITLAVGIVQAMILARTLSKELYGTYSEALLVISFFSPLFSLGLDNAINYFFNKTNDFDCKSNYINTIVFLSGLFGLCGGIILFICKNVISAYYGNSEIIPIMIYIAFRPCLTNLIALYQPLYISSGYARVIAIRNLVISICQVLIIALCSARTDNLTTIFLFLLILDIVQLFFFAQYYGHNNFHINPFKYKREYIKSILTYAVPMMLANAVSTLSINMDNLVISNLMTVKDYALYTNMSKELPFSFIAASFTAVVTPQIVKLLSNNKIDKFRALWSDYLEIGYTVTWPLCIGAFLMAPQLIEILYSTKYLDTQGIIVFRIYTIVAMIRFTYFGMVPTALGETKIVFYYSLISLGINMCLNYLFFYLIGMCGPPFATFLSIVIMGFFYFRRSMLLTKSNFVIVFRLKKALILCIEMIIVGVLTIYFNKLISLFSLNVIVDFLAGFCFFVGIIFLLKYKDMKRLINNMNKV